MSFSFGREPSKDANQEGSKGIKSSFTEGSSKIFGSVKKGFFDGISSTFDQVVNIVGSNEEEKPAQNEQNIQESSDENAQKTEEQKKTNPPSKPKPPKPPAPLSKQKSEQGSNSSLNKTPKPSENPPPGKPFLKRRNTNPFMEDYEPASSEADLPSTVVAEVYQMVSALYSDEEAANKENELKNTVGGRNVSSKDQEDADSEGTEGCDDVADLQSVEDDTRGTEEIKDPIVKECENFMKEFVTKVFDSSVEITPDYKTKFGKLSQKGFGRFAFADYVNKKKTGDETKIADETFYALIQFFTIVLYECYESEDFGPAKSLMNSCFIFYCETDPAKGPVQKQFLYSFLKDLPIWHSPKFWNAAYFFAIQHERAANTGKKEATDEEALELAYKKLLITTHYMRMLGLSKEQCLEFIKRQASTAQLTPEHVRLLREKMEKWHEGYDVNESSGAMWFISQKAKAVHSAARLLKDGFSFKSISKSDS